MIKSPEKRPTNIHFVVQECVQEATRNETQFKGNVFFLLNIAKMHIYISKMHIIDL